MSYPAPPARCPLPAADGGYTPAAGGRGRAQGSRQGKPLPAGGSGGAGEFISLQVPRAACPLPPARRRWRLHPRRKRTGAGAGQQAGQAPPRRRVGRRGGLVIKKKVLYLPRLCGRIFPLYAL
jgi:hypothetical protein